jgi:magnesium transporter
MGVYQRVERTLGNLYDSLQELRATNDSLLNTKQNEIMKTLTVLAFLFLPLTFITGVFGMNTVNDPIIGGPGDFYILTGGMVVIAVCCFVYFRHRDWL